MVWAIAQRSNFEGRGENDSPSSLNSRLPIRFYYILDPKESQNTIRRIASDSGVNASWRDL
jgi:hypothetical protein